MIYTIGHSTRSIDEFLDLLKEFSIEVLVDVRTYPGSRRYPHFNAENMAEWLWENEVVYEHHGDLGGRRGKQDVHPMMNDGWTHASFRNYADYALGDAYQDGLGYLIGQSEYAKTAFMCSEAVPWKCHRSIISNNLVAKEVSVRHILGRGQIQDHVLGQWGPQPTTFGDRLVYPKNPALFESHRKG